MKRIISVKPLPNYRLHLRYDDGVEGEVDLFNEVGKGIFEAWKDASRFSSVRIERKGRALEWPGEIDLCADALYLEITGLKAADLFPKLKHEPANA